LEAIAGVVSSAKAVSWQFETEPDLCSLLEQELITMREKQAVSVDFLAAQIKVHELKGTLQVS
jgi:hypothetical protein